MKIVERKERESLPSPPLSLPQSLTHSAASHSHSCTVCLRLPLLFTILITADESRLVDSTIEADDDKEDDDEHTSGSSCAAEETASHAKPEPRVCECG